MKIDLKIEALAGGSLNNIPVLANRAYASEVTIADGATALLASTLTRQESAAISGIPGLGELPGFQTATADTTTQKDTSELILLITPACRSPSRKCRGRAAYCVQSTLARKLSQLREGCGFRAFFGRRDVYRR